MRNAPPIARPLVRVPYLEEHGLLIGPCLTNWKIVGIILPSRYNAFDINGGLLMTTSRILIVDDSDTIRNTLRLTLEFKGYEVFEAANGQEGLDLIRQNSYDLIICDLGMPVLDGLTLIKEVRNGLGMTSLPIIVLSAEENKEKRKAIEAGANEIIDKPFSPKQVLSALEHVFKSKN